MVAVVTGVIDQAGWGMRLSVAAGKPGSLSAPFAEAKRYSALLDTGATNCMITQQVIDDLGLEPTGRQITSDTAGGSTTGDSYFFDLGFTAVPQYGTNFVPFHRTVWKCEAVILPPAKRAFEIVIGMNVLTTTGVSLLPSGDFFIHV